MYFRHAQAERGALPYSRPVRLVFDVRLDGSARKLVTVRSALVLVNKLPDTVDVKLVERSPVNAGECLYVNSYIPGVIWSCLFVCL